MQQFKISTVVAILVTGVLLGTAVDALLNVGDTFNGDVLMGETDIVEFEGLAGEKFTGNVKPQKGSTLFPNIKLIAPDMSVVAEAAATKKKVALKGIELPMTGVYQIEVGGENDTEGTYKLKTKSKLGKTIKRRKNQTAVGNTKVDGDTQDTDFEAKSEVPDPKDPSGPMKAWLLNGKIQSPKKSEAVPFNPVVYGPSSDEGEKGDPLELTGFISKNKKGAFQIKNLVLPDLGTYTLSVENTGISGVINTNLKIKPPKIKKQTIDKEGVK